MTQKKPKLINSTAILLSYLMANKKHARPIIIIIPQGSSQETKGDIQSTDLSNYSSQDNYI